MNEDAEQDDTSDGASDQDDDASDSSSDQDDDERLFASDDYPSAYDMQVDSLRTVVVATADYTVYAYDFDPAALDKRTGPILVRSDAFSAMQRRAEREVVLGRGLDFARCTVLCPGINPRYVNEQLADVRPITVKYMLWPSRDPVDAAYVPGLAVVERRDDRAHVELICNQSYDRGGGVLLGAVETDLATRYPLTARLDLNAATVAVVPFYLAHGYKLVGRASTVGHVRAGNVRDDDAPVRTVYFCYSLGPELVAVDHGNRKPVVVATLTVPRAATALERQALDLLARAWLVRKGGDDGALTTTAYAAAVVSHGPQALEQLQRSLSVAWAEASVQVVVATDEYDMHKRLLHDADAKQVQLGDARLDALRTVVAAADGYTVFRYDFSPVAEHDGPTGAPVSAEQRTLERQVVLGHGSNDVAQQLCPTVDVADAERLFRSTQRSVVKYLLWSSRPFEERRHDLPGLAVVSRAGDAAILELVSNQPLNAGGARLLEAVAADLAQRYPLLRPTTTRPRWPALSARDSN
jgi:hypothetical protein